MQRLWPSGDDDLRRGAGQRHPVDRVRDRGRALGLDDARLVRAAGGGGQVRRRQCTRRRAVGRVRQNLSDREAGRDDERGGDAAEAE